MPVFTGDRRSLTNSSILVFTIGATAYILDRISEGTLSFTIGGRGAIVDRVNGVNLPPLEGGQEVSEIELEALYCGTQDTDDLIRQLVGEATPASNLKKTFTLTLWESTDPTAANGATTVWANTFVVSGGIQVSDRGANETSRIRLRLQSTTAWPAFNASVARPT